MKQPICHLKTMNNLILGNMRDNVVPIQHPFRDINKFTLRFRNAMTKN